MLKRLFVCMLVLVLSACGFQLRGLGSNLPPFPFQSVLLEDSTSLAASLRTVIKREPRITLVENAKEAEAVLKVSDEQTQKDILMINRGGNVNEYLLTLRVKAQLLTKGVPYGEPMDVFVRRTYTYSDNQVLGKAEEEQMLWQDMRSEAADQIMRRLAHLRPTQLQAEEPAVQEKTETSSENTPKKQNSTAKSRTKSSKNK
ncbi:LPS assembly lipoprotein LptE [Neisseria sp. Ec49-e6-T10]|uniref:LPS-assembly lipoprotein LptE n=1 Tax=Neisseria sp. Ec49-e6-T10 TaxID=3140744 RepID=UPI003EB976F3